MDINKTLETFSDHETFMHYKTSHTLFYNIANHPLRSVSPSEGAAPLAPPLGHLRLPFGKPPPSAAVKEKKYIFWRHIYLGPYIFKIYISNHIKILSRAMRIPNMCLILKLDNGKVISIANGQNHRTI